MLIGDFTEIGEIADSEELCEGADAFYDATTRKCSCIRNYFALNNLRSCIKRKCDSTKGVDRVDRVAFLGDLAFLAIFV